MENIRNLLEKTADRVFFTINRIDLERKYPDVQEAKKQVREIEVQARQTASQIAWDLREVDEQGKPKSANQLKPKDILDYLKIAHRVAATQAKMIRENENVREMGTFDKEISAWRDNIVISIGPVDHIYASEELPLKDAIKAAEKANFKSGAWEEVAPNVKETEMIIRGLKEAGVTMERRIFKKPTTPLEEITVLPAFRIGRRIYQPEVTLAQIQNHLLQTIQRYTS